MELEADRCVSLASLDFVEHVDSADVERSDACMVAEMESIVNTEEILDLQDTDHKGRMVSDVKLVELPRLH